MIGVCKTSGVSNGDFVNDRHGIIYASVDKMRGSKIYIRPKYKKVLWDAINYLKYFL